jgi:hypothetical protein
VSAVGTAEKALIVLHTVAYNSASTVKAGWGKGLDRALKAIKGIGSTVEYDIERFIVCVMTDKTRSHRSPCEYGGIVGRGNSGGNEVAQGDWPSRSNFRASRVNSGESKYIAKPIGRFEPWL